MAARTEKNLILEDDEQGKKAYVERLGKERKKFQETFERRRKLAKGDDAKKLDDLYSVYLEYNNSQDEVVRLALLGSKYTFQ